MEEISVWLARHLMEFPNITHFDYLLVSHKACRGACDDEIFLYAQESSLTTETGYVISRYADNNA